MADSRLGAIRTSSAISSYTTRAHDTDFDKSAKAFVLFCLYFNFGLGNRTPAIEGQTNEKTQLI